MVDNRDELARWQRARRMDRMLARYLVLLVIVLGVVLASFSFLDGMNTRSSAYENVPLDVRRLLRLQLDEETGLRGFAATGQRVFLQPYNQARPLIGAAERSLRARMTVQTANLAHFMLLHRAWEQTVAIPILRDPRNRMDSSSERAGKLLMDRMRNDIAAIDAAYAALAARVAVQERGLEYFTAGVIVLCIIGMSFVALRMERLSAQRERRLLLGVIEKRDTAARMSDWRMRVIAMLAHDFKSVLSVINGYAEMLEDFPERRSEPGTYAGIHRAVDQLATMADEALLMARVATGNLNIRAEDTAIWQIVNEVAERYRHERTVTVSPSYEIVRGDRDYLLRLFDNLVGNAVKYSPQDAPIDVQIDRTASSEIAVCVKDSGRGIDAKDLPHVFEEYWRSSTATEGSGNGVGLFIAKKIVDAHGGSISIRSAPGAGTAICVRLPAGAEIRSPLLRAKFPT